MARDVKLHSEYSQQQRGMNTGLNYENWLESEILDLRAGRKAVRKPLIDFLVGHLKNEKYIAEVVVDDYLQTR